MEDKDFSNLSDDNRANLNQGNLSWNTASAIRGEDGYNPNSLADIENSSTSGEKIAENDVLNSENSPWTTNFNQGGTHKSRSSNSSFSTKGAKKFLKAKIATAILGGGSVIGIGIGSIFTAGLAPIHVKEIITEKANVAASVMERMSPSLMSNKFRNKGAKCGVIKAACKFEKVSTKQKTKLEKAGFEIEVDGDGRISKMVDIETKAEITNTNLHSKLKTDPRFRTALNKAYNGRFASFLDDVASKFMKKFGFTKTKGDNKGKSETELDNEMTETANNKGEKIDPKVEEAESDAEGDSDDVKSDKARQRSEVEKNKSLLNDIKSDAPKLSKLDIKARAVELKAKFDKVSAWQLPCTIYSIGNMIHIGVKVVRAVQLAQFAFSFLSFADKIKSGQPTTEEFAMIGNKMMGFSANNNSGSESNNSNQQSKIQKALSFFAEAASNNNKKGFTDSQGWRALAYNDRLGKLDDSASKYSVGAVGVFASWFQKVRKTVNDLTGNNANRACKIITSDGADIAELIINVAISFTPIGLLTAVGSFAAEQIIGNLIGEALEGVPGMLVGQIVNENTKGEDYGNSVMSGVGSLMSKNAISGGVNTLSKQQAVAFYKQNEIQIAENGAYERSIRNPFDPTTRHTFLGSIVSSIIPYQGSIASFIGFFPSMVSIGAKSISSILPGASAADTAGFEANMEICQDDDLKQMNIATDAFCNPYTGIPDSTINKDISEIIEYLASKNYIKTDIEDPRSAVMPDSKLSEFIKKCPERENPIGVGSSPEEFGLECSSENNPDAAYFSSYLTYIRMQEGMDMDFEPLLRSNGNSSTSFAGNAKSKNCKEGDICWPIEAEDIKTTITSPFGFYSGTSIPHHGIDFGDGGVTFGTPVYAIADGEVVGVGNQSAWGGPAWTYGPNILNGGSAGSCPASVGGGGGEHVVNLLHKINGQEIFSAYLHMQKNSDLKVGQKIKAGTQVGEVGSYGCSTGAHLHLEIKDGGPNGQSVDPSKYLGAYQ